MDFGTMDVFVPFVAGFFCVDAGFFIGSDLHAAISDAAAGRFIFIARSPLRAASVDGVRASNVVLWVGVVLVGVVVVVAFGLDGLWCTF